MCATLIDPNQPNQCFTASPVRARERQIRAPEKGILGWFSRVPYATQVTVYPYNRYIRGTNPIVRHVMSLTCTLKRMRANQHAPKHATTQPLHWLKYARPSTKCRGVIGAQCRSSYTDNVTVNRCNGHIKGTNLIVRHGMSLTCTLKRMRANQHAPKHATTQLLHYSNMRARAPDLVASYIMRSHSSQQYGQGAPSRVMLLVTATTDILVQMWMYGAWIFLTNDVW